MDTSSLSQDLVTRHVVGRIINAIAAGDWDALAANVHQDMIYWRPGTLDRIDGAEKYVDQWRALFHGEGWLEYRAHTVLVQGDTAMVEATAEGRLPDGTEATYSLVTVMRIDDGLLVEEREYIVPRTY